MIFNLATPLFLLINSSADFAHLWASRIDFSEPSFALNLKDICFLVFPSNVTSISFASATSKFASSESPSFGKVTSPSSSLASSSFLIVVLSRDCIFAFLKVSCSVDIR